MQERSTGTRTSPLRVFIAHRQADCGSVERLRDASRHVPQLELHSFPYGAAETGPWQDTCRALIGSSDAVVCLAGPTTRHSPHVAWELAQATHAGIPIVFAGSAARALADAYGGVAAQVIEDDAPEAVIDRLRRPLGSAPC